MKNAIIEILMKRDGMTREQAHEQVMEAREAMYDYIESGDYESAEEVLTDLFGLEPDYIDYLI